MRLGRFLVADSVKDEQAIVGLLTLMDIRREQPDMHVAGVTEYLAVFAEFDDLSEGDVIPLYEFVFKREVNGSVTRETRKV